MLVKCPSCGTTYKVADEILTGTTPAFRCSRCKHMFEGDLNTSVEAVPPRAESEAKNQGDNEDDLAFVFEPEDQEPRDDRNQEESNPSPPTHFPPPDPVDSLVEQETQRW